MDCVVRAWLRGTISDDLIDSISERHATARTLWLAIESQFLGNRATRALYADADFRAFSQGDLPVADYCRLYKRKAENLRDLGEPVSDRTLVLNIICGLSERFAAIGLQLRHTNPLPTFLQVRDDLRMEELTMAKAAPATVLLTTNTKGAPFSGTKGSAPFSPQRQGSNNGGHKRGKRGGKRSCGGGNGNSFVGSSGGGHTNRGGHNSGGAPSGAASSASGPFSGGGQRLGFWPSYQNPWSGSHMWPGAQGPPAPLPPPPRFHQQQQALLAGQWAGQRGVPSPALMYGPPEGVSSNAGWDQQALAAQFQTMQLQQPAQLDCTKMYYDLKERFWWPGMKRSVAEYVAIYDTCQRVKAEHQRPAEDFI
ncbi:uncharacterized protein LOC120669341 [Panicum virgatum]|uniref:uncharacterized protein LOC120669341 n=1 Tax=Panicum virgatum TaxID=38727 RepID=UPI0019D686CA|nr:uncharacterized protein LOC120669341 [Panicum virgatum]